MNPQIQQSNLQNTAFFTALSAADQVLFLQNQSALIGLQAAQQGLQQKGSAIVSASQQADIDSQETTTTADTPAS